ncbi:MAG: hypothetical protein M0Z49_07320 [Chloroflexi bacterium]|nr:hypothetical protein [Chloroflexota bacterium]
MAELRVAATICVPAVRASVLRVRTLPAVGGNCSGPLAGSVTVR